MNPDEVRQVVETIKTLNININDATTQKLVDVLLPIVKLWILKDIFLEVFWGIIFIVAVYLVARAITKYAQARK